MDRPQLLSARRIVLLTVFLVAVLSTQLAAGTVVASPATADTTVRTATDAERADRLGASSSFDELTADLTYTIAEQGVESDFGFAEGTTSPDSDTVVSDLVPSESAVGTLSERMEDVSPLLTLLGYSRYDNSDPLDHDLRASMYDRIQSEAGITLAALVEDSDVSESTVRYHTRILEEESLVEKVALWGNVCLFPATYGAKERALTVALEDSTLRSVLSAVERNEPATVSAVAAEIDRAPSTVSHHLSRLESADLIDRERDGKSVETTLKPTVRQALTSGTVQQETLSATVGD